MGPMRHTSPALLLGLSVTSSKSSSRKHVAESILSTPRLRERNFKYALQSSADHVTHVATHKPGKNGTEGIESERPVCPLGAGESSAVARVQGAACTSFARHSRLRSTSSTRCFLGGRCL